MHAGRREGEVGNIAMVKSARVSMGRPHMQLRRRRWTFGRFDLGAQSGMKKLARKPRGTITTKYLSGREPMGVHVHSNGI